MFLLEKLPKETVQAGEEQTGTSILLTRSIAVELNERLRLSWDPPYCKRKSTRWISPTNYIIEVYGLSIFSILFCLFV